MRVVFCPHCGKSNQFNEEKELIKKASETAAPGQCTDNTLRVGRWSFPSIEHQSFYVPQHMFVGDIFRIASTNEFPFWSLYLQEGQRLHVPPDIAQKLGCDEIVKNAALSSVGDKCLLELQAVSKNLLSVITLYGDIFIKERTQW